MINQVRLGDLFETNQEFVASGGETVPKGTVVRFSDTDWGMDGEGPALVPVYFGSTIAIGMNVFHSEFGQMLIPVQCLIPVNPARS